MFSNTSPYLNSVLHVVLLDHYFISRLTMSFSVLIPTAVNRICSRARVLKCQNIQGHY